MRKYTFLALALALTVSACEFDNFDEPESVLEGKVVYDGQPVSVRSTAVQLELWQSGYQEKENIPVYINQDGTFRAIVFDGDYKVVRKQNNGPWVNNPDTILVTVKGKQTLDVPVQPYAVVNNAVIAKDGANIKATFQVKRVAEGRAIERTALYISKTPIVDANYNNGKVELANPQLDTDLTLSVPLGTLTAGPVYARVGVKLAGLGELIYTQPVKIAL